MQGPCDRHTGISRIMSSPQAIAWMTLRTRLEESACRSYRLVQNVLGRVPRLPQGGAIEATWSKGTVWNWGVVFHGRARIQAGPCRQGRARRPQRRFDPGLTRGPGDCSKILRPAASLSSAGAQHGTNAVEPEPSGMILGHSPQMPRVICGSVPRRVACQNFWPSGFLL